MPNIKAYGTVSETGVLTLSNRKRLQSELTKFKGKAVEIIIKKKDRRSSPQNRYYWGVIVKEVEMKLRDLGNDVDSDIVHDFLKETFNKEDLAGPGGEVIGQKGGSTAEMNKEEMSEYWDRIFQWAAEKLELHIAPPNTDLQLEFTESFYR